MKKSSGSNTFLYIVIIALLVYILFIRNATSGYRSPNMNKAYKAGFDDFNDNKPLDEAMLRTRYVRPNKSVRRHLVNAYKKGWNDAKDVSNKKIKMKTAVSTREAIKAKNDLDKKIKDVRKHMTTTSSSSLPFFESTTSSFFM